MFCPPAVSAQRFWRFEHDNRDCKEGERRIRNPPGGHPTAKAGFKELFVTEPSRKGCVTTEKDAVYWDENRRWGDGEQWGVIPNPRASNPHGLKAGRDDRFHRRLGVLLWRISSIGKMTGQQLRECSGGRLLLLFSNRLRIRVVS